jgi:hypothetical protein
MPAIICTVVEHYHELFVRVTFCFIIVSLWLTNLRKFFPSIDDRAPNVFANTIILNFYDVSTQAEPSPDRMAPFFSGLFDQKNNFPCWNFVKGKHISYHAKTLHLFLRKTRNFTFGGKIPAKTGLTSLR